ncbi:hypothetical protein SFR_4483 [Streptomyces sp. FR-008]|nr:hypothetical protein SFR_4483 [Streptomyces sp. FR-008]
MREGHLTGGTHATAAGRHARDPTSIPHLVHMYA